MLCSYLTYSILYDYPIHQQKFILRLRHGHRVWTHPMSFFRRLCPGHPDTIFKRWPHPDVTADLNDVPLRPEDLLLFPWRSSQVLTSLLLPFISVAPGGPLQGTPFYFCLWACSRQLAAAHAIFVTLPIISKNGPCVWSAGVASWRKRRIFCVPGVLCVLTCVATPRHIPRFQTLPGNVPYVMMWPGALPTSRLPLTLSLISSFSWYDDNSLSPLLCILKHPSPLLV